MAFLKEYELLSELGAVGGGSFAQVYKVRHNQLGYVRAIRVLKDMITNENSKQYKDFIAECKFLLRLGNSGHPNIVRIYQPRLIDHKAFWEMDYIEGDTVDNFIEKNACFVPIEEVNRCLFDISNALAYCHVDNYWFSLSSDEDGDLIEIDPNDGSKIIISDENRAKLIKKYCVVHNDIKSNNVIRKFDGSYILLDFGLSFTAGKNISRSSLMRNGGAEYKAPEKWDLNKELMTESTDIYAFGVLLYEMLTGRTPFVYDKKLSDIAANVELSKHHKNTLPPAIEPLRKVAFEAANPGQKYEKDYPDWLENVIMKCLEKDPNNRYANGKELFEEVKVFLAQPDTLANDLKAENEKLKSEIENLNAQKGNQTAAIHRVWQEHDVIENGLLGMRVHVKFNVLNMLNKNGEVAVWFCYRDGSKLMDSNGLYNSTSGQVAVSKTFTPSYDDAIYDDFPLFLPYSELHLSNNVRTDLSFSVGVFDDNKISMVETPLYDFWHGGSGNESRKLNQNRKLWPFYKNTNALLY